MSLFNRFAVAAPFQAATAQPQDLASTLLLLPQHLICIGLGFVAGSTGVAAAIFSAIVVQFLLAPPATFAPGLVSMTLAGAAFSLGSGWLLAQLARRLVPSLTRLAPARLLQTVLVCSVLVSVTQNIFFAYGL